MKVIPAWVKHRVIRMVRVKKKAKIIWKKLKGKRN